jgi:hypothetical protein
METAGAPPPAPAAPAERVVPAFKPPDILWYFGAFATAFATFEVISKIPDSQRDVWQLLLSLGFFAAYAVAARFLARTWWIAGGLAAALAVTMVPAVGHGFGVLIGTYPSDVFFDPMESFSWTVFLIGVAWMVAGLFAFAVTRFAFQFFSVVLAISVTVQLLVPGIHRHASADDHLVTAILVGVALVLAGLVLDAGGRRRDAFWFHVGGFTNIAVGLGYYAANPNGNSDRGWIPMLIAGAIVLLLSAPLWRGTWAAYGLLGLYAPILHWLTNIFTADTTGRAWLLLAVSVSIFILGFGLARTRRRRKAPATESDGQSVSESGSL